MQTLLRVFGTIGLGLSCLATRADEGKWKPAPSPLVTRYAEQVSPREVPLYEFYPRPLMVRNHDGRNLSGLWDFAVTGTAVEQPPAAYQGKIMVPFPIESALSGVGRSVARNEKLWYHIAVEVPWGADWLKGQNARLMLRLDGVSGNASVFVNGKMLGSHRGSDDGFSFDLTDLVTAKDKPTLEIVVAADARRHPARRCGGHRHLQAGVDRSGPREPPGVALLRARRGRVVRPRHAHGHGDGGRRRRGSRVRPQLRGGAGQRKDGRMPDPEDRESAAVDSRPAVHLRVPRDGHSRQTGHGFGLWGLRGAQGVARQRRERRRHRAAQQHALLPRRRAGRRLVARRRCHRALHRSHPSRHREDQATRVQHGPQDRSARTNRSGTSGPTGSG